LNPPPRHCLHCRAPLSGRADAAFCCSGCEGAHRLLRDAGLERYYELQSGQGTPGDETPNDFPWLAAVVEVARSRSRQPTRVTVELDAQGLHCAGCVWVIQTLFQRQPGSHHIAVNPGVGRLALTLDPSLFPLEPFLKDLARLGYRTGPPVRQPESTSDGLGIRLGAAFAIAMNSMALSLSGYFGLEPGDADGIHALFGWVNFGLSILALLIGGPVFIRGALHALRRRTLHLDVPIALGLVLAFSGSAFLFLSGHEDAAYFDTLNIFVALMLLGRWAQRRILERNRRLLLDDDGMLHARIRVIGSDGRIHLTPLASLVPGMRVMVTPGELVPVLAALPAGANAEFSLAWLTGESDPIAFDADRPVPAGAHLLGRSAVTLEVREAFSSSALQRILERPDDSLETPTDRFWHHLTSIYVVTVVAFAALAFALWLDAGWVEALGVATAVLVITCPCALGLATPLAYELAHHRLRRLGLHARRQGLLDAARRVRHVVFDKTGTLTLGNLELDAPGHLAALPGDAREALAQLTARSNHPKSKAIFSALGTLGDVHLDDTADVAEVPGLGLVSGDWRLVKDGEALALKRGSERVATFGFKEVLRADARDEVARLSARGVQVHVATGDNATRAAAIGDALGLPPARILSGLSPADKAALIERLGPASTLMLGDGINDALAFDAAGLAGTPAIDRAALPSRSDFYLTTRGIGPISALLEEAARVQRQTRVNIAFAITYNVLGLSAALAGLLSPVACAVAMPMSSLLVLAVTAATSGIARDRRAPAACPLPPAGLEATA
jgi:Cu2+-exporting ATPase